VYRDPVHCFHVCMVCTRYCVKVFCTLHSICAVSTTVQDQVLMSHIRMQNDEELLSLFCCLRELNED
jgi:hypothetical protein